MVILEESPWYNEILRRGEARGEARGRQEEASSFVLRQLTRRFGSIAPDLQTQIQAMSLDRLESLGEALLDFSTLDDLTHWLN